MPDLPVDLGIGDASMLRRSLRIDDGAISTKVLVSIAAPVQDNEKAWVCRYEIDWPSLPKRGDAYGVDSVQAMQLCFNIIAVHLYTSEYHRRGQLCWEQPGDGYGFPLSRASSDLAQGGDRDL